MFWENKKDLQGYFFKLMQADEMIILPKQSRASPMTKIVCWDDYQFAPVCCNQSLSYKWKGTMRRESHAKETKKKRQTVDVSERQFTLVILRILTSHLQNVLNSAQSYFHWEHYDTGLGCNRWRRSANQKPPSTTSAFLMTSTYW